MSTSNQPTPAPEWHTAAAGFMTVFHLLAESYGVLIVSPDPEDESQDFLLKDLTVLHTDEDSVRVNCVLQHLAQDERIMLVEKHQPIALMLETYFQRGVINLSAEDVFLVGQLREYTVLFARALHKMEIDVPPGFLR